MPRNCAPTATDGGEGASARSRFFFDSVQLTFRFLDDVVSDLAAKGYNYKPIDIGYRVEPGFAIFSLGSTWARDDPAAAEMVRPRPLGLGGRSTRTRRACAGTARRLWVAPIRASCT